MKKYTILRFFFLLILIFSTISLYASAKSFFDPYKELNNALPNETKCNGEIVKNLVPLGGTIDNTTPGINKTASQIKYYSAINCIEKTDKTVTGFLLEKTVFKDGLYLIVKKPQTFEYSYTEYYFILPANLNVTNNVNYWYKKAIELTNKIRYANNTNLDNAIATLNKAIVKNSINTYEGTKRLDFGTEILCSNKDLNETITLNKPIYLKNKKWMLFKLTYALGPM